MKNWKKRWFVLHDGNLYYYKTEVLCQTYNEVSMYFVKLILFFLLSGVDYNLCITVVFIYLIVAE